MMLRESTTRLYLGFKGLSRLSAYALTKTMIYFRFSTYTSEGQLPEIIDWGK